MDWILWINIWIISLECNRVGFSKEQVIAFNKEKVSVSEDFFDFLFK